MSKFNISFLGLACCIVCFVGCQKNNINTVPVEVTVMYKDAVVEGALVTFHPLEKGPDVRSASGMTKADGKVVPLTPPGNKGVVPGKYKVTIMKTPTIGGGGSSDPAASDSSAQSYEEIMAANKTTKPADMKVDAKHQLPLKYTSEKSTDLEIDVVKGGKITVTYELKD